MSPSGRLQPKMWDTLANDFRGVWASWAKVRKVAWMLAFPQIGCRLNWAQIRVFETSWHTFGTLHLVSAAQSDGPWTVVHLERPIRLEARYNVAV